MSRSLPPSFIDPQAVLRLQRLRAAESPWLHEEVAARMQQRLAWVKRSPQRWVHWNPLQGGLCAHALVAQRYPRAVCQVVQEQSADLALVQKKLRSAWWLPKRWFKPAVCYTYPAEGSAQLLWANMVLHRVEDAPALLARWHRALAVDGFVMFSCLGPDSLLELRRLYAALGWSEPAHVYTDMHDWGDLLLQTGFAEPVMDVERITLTFETPQRLLQELRGLGRNLHRARFAALRGRGWLAQLHQALASAPLQITFEIIYGHAFKPAPAVKLQPQTVLSLEQMRASLRRHPNRPSGPLPGLERGPLGTEPSATMARFSA